jgi:hypothetical protein
VNDAELSQSSNEYWSGFHAANPVTIKKTAWGYSMYDTPSMTSDPHDGLIASSDKLADQLDFAARMGWPYVIEEES